MFLSLPPLGNDLEALQIHLCFCCSNLHPRRAARSGSTLVSAVSNIYLSQQTGGETRKLLETWDRHAELSAGHLLAACGVVLCGRGFETDWICPCPQLLHQPVQKTRQNHILWFQHLLVRFCFIPVIFPPCCWPVSHFPRIHFSSQLFKGFFSFFFFFLLLLVSIRLYMYIHMCIHSIYCMKDFFPILKETWCTLNLAVVSL